MQQNVKVQDNTENDLTLDREWPDIGTGARNMNQPLQSN